MTNELTQNLIYLGITPSKQGFNYISFVIDTMNENPCMTLKDVYNKISLTKGVNKNTIDSSIRNVIHTAYDSGKLMRLNLKIGCDVIGDRCPTNKEFISILICYLNKQFESFGDNLIINRGS